MNKEERIKAAIARVVSYLERDDEDFAGEVAHRCYTPLVRTLTNDGELHLGDKAYGRISEFWTDEVAAYLEQEQ